MRNRSPVVLYRTTNRAEAEFLFGCLSNHFGKIFEVKVDNNGWKIESSTPVAETRIQCIDFVAAFQYGQHWMKQQASQTTTEKRLLEAALWLRDQNPEQVGTT